MKILKEIISRRCYSKTNPTIPDNALQQLQKLQNWVASWWHATENKRLRRKVKKGSRRPRFKRKAQEEDALLADINAEHEKLTAAVPRSSPCKPLSE